MLGFGKKPKAQFEISWPVGSHRDHESYAHAPQREAPLPPIPTQSEASSLRSAHSSASLRSNYFLSYSTREHDQHTPAISIPPRTYRMAESSRCLPVHAQHQRPTTSSTDDSRHRPSSSHSSQYSFASSNTMYTAYTAHRGSRAAASLSSCDDGSCQLGDPDFGYTFEQFQDQIQVSDNLPDAKAIESAGEIPIFDSEGNSQPFKSIYSGDLAIGEQQMVLFVRHFFCGACQAYIRLLSKSISLQTYFTLPVPTSITIIGLGSPKLINLYRKITGTQFPIYADPTKKLYKALGMSWSMSMGPRVDYTGGETEYQWVKNQTKLIMHTPTDLRLKGGNVFWVGGEFMFKDGKPVWCHRMKNYRGHTGIDTIKKLLGVEDEVFYHAM
ncbi:hypothetical protein E2P81_ATG06890 [Venturia nashicola]|uniref:AhpC/TSA antioxidant enzyme-domain-containing protein n=1 Tax=Venturia nashicola TaxID=86259 RepID=A0A4Z1P5R1_9PEZI|nr:hypothetical protein E6O75_ATG07061 [Venturia nashicola]TLD30237.1 hypothetical protein E2P81_ATG06890 [Venturia nashicola]